MSEKIINFWADISDRYDKSIDNILGKNLRPKIKEKLSQEQNMDKTIELGCGTGYFTKILKEKSKTLISTDISNEMLKIAKTNLKDTNEIQFQVMDFQNIKFEDETFNTAFMGLVLLFAEDPQKALNESYRILKPKGSLIIADPDPSLLSGYGKLKFLFRALIGYHKIPATSHFLNQKEILNMLDKSGFYITKKEIIKDKTNPYSLTVNYIKALKQ